MAKEEEGPKHSKLSMVSYGFGMFPNEFFNMAFGAIVFFYYEVEIGLASWLVSLGYIIFAVWNAVNDPFIGYLTDRPFKFTKKWGRRFPFVFVGGIPWILSYILIFTPPSIDPQQGAIIIFIWLVFSTCVYDTMLSLYSVNFYAIFPDKFRSQNERRTTAGLGTLVAAMGTAFGAIIPPLFIVYGELSSYTLQAGVVIIVCLLALMLAIPGAKEDQIRIDCYLEKCEEGMVKQSFFKEYKRCLEHKNYMAVILSFTCYQVLVQLMIGSINYVALFVLGVEAAAVTPIMACLLIGMMCAMPIWAKIADKTNNDRKTFIIGSCLLTVFTIPLFFVNNYLVMIFTILVWGFFEGAYWVLLDPIKATAIDESIANTGQRREGIYQGFQAFFSRAALVAQALSFSLVHAFTGFVEGADSQSGLAIIGIKIHFSIIPAIFMLISTIIIWKFYDLTPDKVKKNRDKIIELGL